jgi:putative PIN family toxin of toxin-antitoxin system
MRVERIVLDTNLLISAALAPQGKPRRVLTWARTNARLIASLPLLKEVRTRLERPKFRKYLSAEDAEGFVLDFAAVCEKAALSGSIRVRRDPDDDMVLETAVAGRADCIVTGDQDLLVLDPFRGIRILTPAAFLEAIATENGGLPPDLP